MSVDEHEIKIGDILHVKLFNTTVMPFKVRYIVKISEVQYSLLATKLTKATRWVMPMLRTKDETYTSMKYNTHLVNCYAGTKDEGYMPRIYLVYRFSGSTEYRAFEEKLKKHAMFSEMIDLDRHHVMYIFDMEGEQMKIFNLFQEGKYSHFPDNYKKKIISFVVNPADVPTEEDLKTTITYGTLYRTDLQRDKIQSLIGNAKLPSNAEYFSIPDEGSEVYSGDIEIPKVEYQQELNSEEQ